MVDAKKKRTFIPIGVKLIGIVSLILIGSLGGMMFLSTGSFGRTMERTLKDDTMNRAEAPVAEDRERSAFFHGHGADFGGRSRRHPPRSLSRGPTTRRLPWLKCPIWSQLSC